MDSYFCSTEAKDEGKNMSKFKYFVLLGFFFVSMSLKHLARDMYFGLRDNQKSNNVRQDEEKEMIGSGVDGDKQLLLCQSVCQQARHVNTTSTIKSA